MTFLVGLGLILPLAHSGQGINSIGALFALGAGACWAELFRSDTKFHSGCGWPSFYQPTDGDAVTLIQDRSFGTVRTEARCARCDSHLGHVFTGEGFGTPTDERWCINSVSLTLEPKEAAPE